MGLPLLHQCHDSLKSRLGLQRDSGSDFQDSCSCPQSPLCRSAGWLRRQGLYGLMSLLPVLRLICFLRKSVPSVYYCSTVQASPECRWDPWTPVVWARSSHPPSYLLFLLASLPPHPPSSFIFVSFHFLLDNTPNVALGSTRRPALIPPALAHRASTTGPPGSPQLFQRLITVDILGLSQSLPLPPPPSRRGRPGELRRGSPRRSFRILRF